MKSRFEALAYSMLGSVAEAEEVVQEARLRLHQLDAPPSSDEAFLYRVVSNLSIDRLRRAKTEREAYFGPWLPEPVLGDVSDELELTQELSIGFMHLLEQLPPSERIVYVLRESFDLPFDELAALLGIRVDTARQRASRARKRMRNQSRVQSFPDAEGKQLLEQLVALVGNADVEGLITLLAEDAIAYTDGGGVVSAAVRPIHGAQRIATVLLHLAAKAGGEAPLEMQLERLSDSWALVIHQGQQVHSIHFIAGTEGKLQRLYTLRNPHKFGHLVF